MASLPEQVITQPDELVQKDVEFAKAVKSVAPNALVTGFVSYGFEGYFNLQGTYSGSGWYTEYWLDQMLAMKAPAEIHLDILLALRDAKKSSIKDKLTKFENLRDKKNLTEVYRDRSLRLAPVDQPMAHEMIGEVRGLLPLGGYRGRPRGDLDALADTIVKLSGLANDPNVLEAEINPLIVRAHGEGVVAVDELVRIVL